MNFNQYKEAMILSIIRLVNIPSVYKESEIEENKPFGRQIDLCLDEALSICKELGFKTYKDPTGYYGYAEVGEGDDYIGILCHLDVVPEGDLIKWETPPYELQVRNDKIYGRGVSDDKGPTVSAIYAVKALMDHNVHFNKRIRLIFGLDEETLWRGMEVYKQKEKAPLCAFAPDGVFPFVFAERGIIQMELSRETKENDIIINGGKNYNSVAMDAYYEGPLVSDIIKNIENPMDFEIKDNKLKIIGEPAHAATPYNGKNAVLYLAELLKSLGNTNDLIYLFTEVFNFDYEKTNLFDEKIEDESGKITVNVGAIEMDAVTTKIKLDLRVPVTYKKEEIIDKIMNKFQPFGFTHHVFSYLEPLHVKLDTEFAKILLSSYQEVTEDENTKPVMMGGGTYARVFPKQSACFGPKLLTSENSGHAPNENIKINLLMDALNIYYLTLTKLNQSNHLL